MKTLTLLGCLMLVLCGCQTSTLQPTAAVGHGTIQFEGTLSSRVHTVAAYVDGHLESSSGGLTFPRMTVPAGSHRIRLQALDEYNRPIRSLRFDARVMIRADQTQTLHVNLVTREDT